MSKPELKCTWTNGLIWAAITSAAAIGIRYALWYFLVWQGDPDIFSDYFCDESLPLLMISFVMPVIMFLFMYRGYMKIAANHPADLYKVAHDKLGKPAIVPVILLVVLEIVWIVVSVIVVYINCELDLFYENDLTVLLTFVAMHFGNLLVDVILFFLGKRFFQPNLVRNSR